MRIDHIHSCHPDSWKQALSDAWRDLGHEVHDHSDRNPPTEAPPGLIVWSWHHGRPVPHIPDAAVSLDLFVGFPKRERMIETSPFWQARHVFTADGGAQWSRWRVNHHWMPPAVRADAIRHGTPRTKWAGYDVLFTGTRIHPSKIRRIALDALDARWRLLWIGPQSEHGSVYGRALNDLIASVPVVYGDSVPGPRYWSDRVPNTIGRGGLLIHPPVEGFAEQGLLDGIHYAAWTDQGDPESLHDLVALYQNPKARQPVIEAGMTLMANQHTWHHRAQQILDTAT